MHLAHRKGGHADVRGEGTLPGKVRVGRAADLGDRTYFFEIIPDLLVIMGFDGYLRDVNTAWQNSVGWSRTELLAKPFLEFVHPEDRTRMETELERVQKGIFMMFLESRFQCKDGSYKWLMWKAAGLPGRSKLYMLGREAVAAKDGQRANRGESVADRRTAGQSDFVQEWLGAGSWEIDLASSRFRWSGPLARMLGFSPDECPATSQAASALVVPEDRERAVKALRDAVRMGSVELDCRLLRADGTVLPVRGVVKAVRDRDGVPKSVWGVVRPLETASWSAAADQAQAEPSDAAATQ